ncbi:type IV secretion protein Rhs [Burkholderia cepacia]|uniref:type IV secretion protein Rhs n=1 Tax=Burkholderia cepacia TaxID=292 RepID=UPI000F5B78BC|nr:type IV secretion protein Rhs [Burkholderia cepacia]
MTIYRDGARIGTGSTASTADAVCYEAETGSPADGVFHTRKVQDYSTALQEWFASNLDAAFSDRSVAQNDLRDHQNALKGRR